MSATCKCPSACLCTKFLRRLTGDITVRCHRHRSYKRKECCRPAVPGGDLSQSDHWQRCGAGNGLDDFASAAVHHRANGKGSCCSAFAPGRDNLYPFFAQNAGPVCDSRLDFAASDATWVSYTPPSNGEPSSRPMVSIVKIGQCVILVRPVVQIERAHAVAFQSFVSWALRRTSSHTVSFLAVLQHY